MDTIKQIREDKELFESWKANIAMAIKDEHHNYMKQRKKKYTSQLDMHKICNNGAENFLNLLIKK